MRGTIVRIGVSGAGALLAVGLLAAPPAGATGSGKQSKTERSGTACFDTSGKTQGRSHSDPDGMSNRGADKPGCNGGFDADKDGNNGCGNDADREDDNNGRCGRQKAQREDRVKAQREDRAKAQRVKVEADRKARCDHKTGATTTSTTAAPTTVSGADAAKECSCPKNPEATASAATVTLQAAGTAPDAAVLAATATVPPAEASPITTAAAPAASVTGVEAATAAGEPQTEVLGETLERPSALARTGAGIGGLALLGGLLCGGGRLAVLARRFLRID